MKVHALALISLALGSSRLAAQSNQSTGPEIATTGTTEIRLPPDHAVVGIGIDSKSETARGAASDNAKITARVVQALRSLGLSATSVTTSQFSVEQNVRFDTRGQNQTPDGFNAHNSVRVETTVPDSVPGIIDAALAAGATRISVQFSSTKANEVRATALDAAYAAAKADAMVLARSAGGSLGALLWASPAGSSFAARSTIQYETVLTAPAAAMPVILPGNVVSSVQVSARWVFIPGAPH